MKIYHRCLVNKEWRLTHKYETTRVWPKGPSLTSSNKCQCQINDITWNFKFSSLERIKRKHREGMNYWQLIFYSSTHLFCYKLIKQNLSHIGQTTKNLSKEYLCCTEELLCMKLRLFYIKLIAQTLYLAKADSDYSDGHASHQWYQPLQSWKAKRMSDLPSFQLWSRGRAWATNLSLSMKRYSKYVFH